MIFFRAFTQAFFALVLLLNLGCHSATTKEEVSENGKVTPAQKDNWPSDMKNMGKDVKALLPFLYDREAFHDPKNKDTIHEALKQFSQVAHKINPETGKKFIGDDLLVEYSLNSLKDDLGRSLYSFESGQLEYSRSVAKASLSYCFQCHSAEQGKNAFSWDMNPLQNLTLAPLEKADLLVALRKFDKAASFMESQLNSSDFLKNYTFDFEAMLRRYLALTIRVENAPKRALKELNKILDRKETPPYIAQQADGWRASLKKWKQEKKKVVRTPQELFEQVEKRFKNAEGIQHFEKDHAGDVEYLRATAMLHENLKMLTKPADQANALYLLGRAYEVLDELGSWNLHETYYEACIEKSPKAEVARRCYSRLEASLYMGYSGSSGTHLPNEERERLKRLKDKL